MAADAWRPNSPTNAVRRHSLQRKVLQSHFHIGVGFTRSRVKDRTSQTNQQVRGIATTKTILSTREPRLKASRQAATQRKSKRPLRIQVLGATGSRIQVPTPDSINRAGKIARSTEPASSGRASANQPLRVGTGRVIVLSMIMERTVAYQPRGSAVVFLQAVHYQPQLARP